MQLSQEKIKNYLAIIQLAMSRAKTEKQYQRLWQKWINLFNQLSEMENRNEQRSA